MNGETEFAGMLVERFAGYHRQSYGGCKVGVGDVIIGAAALAAEYNGCEKASAVKDKLVEMTHLNETMYCCGIACSADGHPTKAGNYEINLLEANVCKQNVTRFPYEIARLAEDIAGGLMVTMPSERTSSPTWSSARTARPSANSARPCWAPSPKLTPWTACASSASWRTSASVPPRSATGPNRCTAPALPRRSAS